MCHPVFIHVYNACATEQPYYIGTRWKKSSQFLSSHRTEELVAFSNYTGYFSRLSKYNCCQFIFTVDSIKCWQYSTSKQNISFNTEYIYSQYEYIIYKNYNLNLFA